MTINAQKRPDYKNKKLSVEKRVASLLKLMTLEEKIAQLGQLELQNVPRTEKGMAPRFSKNAPGMFSINPQSSIKDTAAAIGRLQKFLKTKTRLGIPALIGAEALHGVLSPGATIYPQAIALGSTWNPKLIKEMGKQIAKEASLVGINQALSPVLDLGRDPRYGRIEECYSECPILTSRMGVAFITGMQGDNASKELAPDRVFCMLKHFAGYSVPANGINIAPVLIGKREMYSLHLLPFEIAVKKAHVMSIMPSYNSVDGIPSHASKWLLTTLLRDEWGFKGYVYADWSAIDNMLVGHRVAANKSEAGLLALTAGVDMEAPSLVSYAYFPKLIEEKKLDIAYINQAVSRILRAKFIAGLFDEKRPEHKAVELTKSIRSTEHVAFSQKLAEESIILLQNSKKILPLNPEKLKSIALIGPNAAQVQFGDYTWSKSNKHGINIMKAMKQQYGKKIKINYAKGCDLTSLSTAGFKKAVDVAEASDVAVVVIGDTSMIFSGVGWEDPTVPSYGTVGEGFDTNNPVPPGVQGDLVKAIVATGKPTIVILLNGRPYCIPWMKKHVPAIIEAFYPGEQQGTAIVNVLFGKTNPSGRLPVTIARSAGHIPCTYDYKPYSRGFYGSPGTPGGGGRDYIFDTPSPLWSFGFGLSYPTFKYSGLTIDKSAISAKDGTVTISFNVENTGKVVGKVVPQVYWRDLVASTAPPEKQLLRFSKIELAPGESRKLSYKVPVNDFWGIDTSMKKVVEPGDINILVGDYAEARGLLRKKLTITP